MSWRLGNGIRSRLQTGLQLWGTREMTETNRAWEDIKESIRTSAKESLGVQDQKKYKPWFDEECLGFLD